MTRRLKLTNKAPYNRSLNFYKLKKPLLKIPEIFTRKVSSLYNINAYYVIARVNT